MMAVILGKAFDGYLGVGHINVNILIYLHVYIVSACVIFFNIILIILFSIPF